MRQNLDLLGEPLPDPLPENQEFRSWEQLVGHTIKAVIESPSGKRRCDALIVTETRCYLAVIAEPEDDEVAHLTIPSNSYGSKESCLSDWASAQQLLRENCISKNEFDVMRAQEVAAAKALHDRQLEQAKARVRALEQTVAALSATTPRFRS
jgi:hypothetical protein